MKVQPGAKKDKILGLWDRRLRLSVRAPAEKGRANEAVIELLEEALGMKRSGMAIVAGETSREKTVRVAGARAAEIAERVRALLP